MALGVTINRRSFLVGPAIAGKAGALFQTAAPPRFPDVIREPDHIAVQLEQGTVKLRRSGTRWTGDGIEVVAEPRTGIRQPELPIRLSAPGTTGPADPGALERRGAAGCALSWRSLGARPTATWSGAATSRTA